MKASSVLSQTFQSGMARVKVAIIPPILLHVMAINDKLFYEYFNPSFVLIDSWVTTSAFWSAQSTIRVQNQEYTTTLIHITATGVSGWMCGFLNLPKSISPKTIHDKEVHGHVCHIDQAIHTNCAILVKHALLGASTHLQNLHLIKQAFLILNLAPTFHVAQPCFLSLM